MSICEHCKHYKKQTLKGKIVSDDCKKESNKTFMRLHNFNTCNGFSRSWKSRLRLVTEIKE